MALKKAKDESMASVVEQIEQENIRQLKAMSEELCK